MRLFRTLFFSLLAFGLTNCDPGHKITYTVENNSSRQVVLISTIFDKDKNKIILGPNESKVVSEGGLGGYTEVKKYEYCPYSDPEIQIYPVDTTLKITKDIKSLANWSRTEKRKHIKGGVFTCKFTLTDQDIN